MASFLLLLCTRFRHECVGPAAVGFDDLVDLGHDADGLAKRDDDLLVVVDVLVGTAERQGYEGGGLFALSSCGSSGSGSAASRQPARTISARMM